MDNNNKQEQQPKNNENKKTHINYRAYMPWLLVDKTMADKYTSCCFCCAFDCILLLLCIIQQQAQLQQQPELDQWEWKDSYKLILFFLIMQSLLSNMKRPIVKQISFTARCGGMADLSLSLSLYIYIYKLMHI